MKLHLKLNLHKSLTKFKSEFTVNKELKMPVNRGQEAANKTLSYNIESITEDIASLMETIWNMTAFEGAEVPDILHPKLWSEEFSTFLDSVMNSDDIDFTM